MSQKTDLSWLKSIFEHYQKTLDNGITKGLFELQEYKFKREASVELLEEIKRFIKAANVLVEKNNGEKQD